MQGTIVMMMALSGLGCHHKSCAPVMASSCYASCYSAPYGSCYASTQAFVAPTPAVDCCPTAYVAPSCYGGCYGMGYATAAYLPAACYDSAYTGCYGGSCYGGSCYGGGCYGGRRHGGLFACLFGGHKRRAASACCSPYQEMFPTSGCYGGGYSPAVYGSYTPVYGSGQGMATGQYMGSAPSKSYGAPVTPQSSYAPATPPSGTPAADTTPDMNETPAPAPAPAPNSVTEPTPAAPTPAGTTPPAAPVPNTPGEAIKEVVPAAPAPAAPVAPTLPRIP